ncbi:MAG: tRNA-binding protein [Pseudomonadota bacterium]
MAANQIVYDDFAKIDMRVGRVIDVQPFPRARNPSYKVTVDFGDIGTRQSSAQITNYTPDALIGRLVVCVINMPPRNIAGFQSEVLILGASDSEGKIILLAPDTDIPLGNHIH